MSLARLRVHPTLAVAWTVRYHRPMVMSRWMVTAALPCVLLAQDPGAGPVIHGFNGKAVAAARIDQEAVRLMTAARVNGLAMAVIDEGQVVFTRAWGRRNVAKNLPLQTDTIMYGASLTKFAFAYMVMQLVDEGKVDLDRSIANYLAKPLPEYPFYDGAEGRRSLAHAHAADPPEPLERAGQFRLPRTRREDAAPFRSRDPLRLFRRGHHPAAVRARDRARPERRRRDAAPRVRPLRHDADRHDVARGLRREPGRRLRDRRRLRGARPAQQAAGGGIDGHDHHGRRDVPRRLLARRRPVAAIARGDGQAADADHHAAASSRRFWRPARPR